MTDNPYQSPSARAEQRPATDQFRKSLWRAYAFAPAVAPVSFVLLLFLIGAIATAFNIEVNPTSFLVLPVVALTAGMVICYLVAGCIGMPIAFYLRKRNSLNGYTIHGAAFCWSIFTAVVVATPMSFSQGAKWYHIPLAILVLVCVIAPPVLLSATVFWLLVRRNGGLSTVKAK
jgi:hypothetical protein